MGDAGQRVVVNGLREFGAGLKALEDGAQLQLGAMFKGIAEGVVADLRPRVPVISGKAAGSYKARGSARGASIVFGGARTAYVPWLDFGGKLKPVGNRHGTQSRPVIKGGRYLYPAIADNMSDVEELVGQAIDEIAGQYGMKTEQG